MLSKLFGTNWKRKYNTMCVKFEELADKKRGNQDNSDCFWPDSLTHSLVTASLNDLWQ